METFNLVIFFTSLMILSYLICIIVYIKFFKYLKNNYPKKIDILVRKKTRFFNPPEIIRINFVSWQKFIYSRDKHDDTVTKKYKLLYKITFIISVFSFLIDILLWRFLI
jgi:hypothetical protein